MGQKCHFQTLISTGVVFHVGEEILVLMCLSLTFTIWIEGFHVMSYRANFASHHTRDSHVGFLCTRSGIGKYNKMSRYFLFSSYHNTKLQLSDKNTLGGNFNSFCEINQKFKHFFIFSIPRYTKRKPSSGAMSAYCVPQTLYVDTNCTHTPTPTPYRYCTISSWQWHQHTFYWMLYQTSRVNTHRGKRDIPACPQTGCEIPMLSLQTWNHTDYTHPISSFHSLPIWLTSWYLQWLHTHQPALLHTHPLITLPCHLAQIFTMATHTPACTLHTHNLITLPSHRAQILLFTMVTHTHRRALYTPTVSLHSLPIWPRPCYLQWLHTHTSLHSTHPLSHYTPFPSGLDLAIYNGYTHTPVCTLTHPLSHYTPFSSGPDLAIYNGYTPPLACTLTHPLSHYTPFPSGPDLAIYNGYTHTPACTLTHPLSHYTPFPSGPDLAIYNGYTHTPACTLTHPLSHYTPFPSGPDLAIYNGYTHTSLHSCTPTVSFNSLSIWTRSCYLQWLHTHQPALLHTHCLIQLPFHLDQILLFTMVTHTHQPALLHTHCLIQLPFHLDQILLFTMVTHTPACTLAHPLSHSTPFPSGPDLAIYNGYTHTPACTLAHPLSHSTPLPSGPDLAIYNGYTHTSLHSCTPTVSFNSLAIWPTSCYLQWLHTHQPALLHTHQPALLRTH